MVYQHFLDPACLVNHFSLSSLSEEPEECQPPVVTATEVWIWGKNDHCQLGIGDQLDRAFPIELKGFRGEKLFFCKF